MRIAFYAPLKAPDHPVPSGDREMARLLIQALRRAGHEVELASTLRSFFSFPDRQALAALEVSASAEVERLVALWPDGQADRVPDVWFTYHPYYKAPDLIGPAVARRLAIPYVTAEASYAGKRNRGWGPWQHGLGDALRHGAAHFCFTAVDAAGLADLIGSPKSLIELPPFVDVARLLASAGPRRRAVGGTVQLVTVAMMRPGVKLRSYAFLADTLQRLAALDWHLTIVGDGSARDAVRRAFAGVPPQRLTWRGAVPSEAIPRELVRADLYLWPGFGEAYGMAYIEAQALGLPVVALDSGGVASAMRAGETGLLVEEGGLDRYADAVGSLIREPERRLQMSAAARAFVLDERSLTRAAAILDGGLTAARRNQESARQPR